MLFNQQRFQNHLNHNLVAKKPCFCYGDQRKKYLALFHHIHQNNVIFVLCFQTNSKLFCNFFYWQVHGLNIVHLGLWRLETNNSKASISWPFTKIKVDHLSKSLSLWCFIITPLSFVNITKAPYNPIPTTLLIHCASKRETQQNPFQHLAFHLHISMCISKTSNEVWRFGKVAKMI